MSESKWINKKDITSDGIEFQLTTLESKEVFRIWDVKGHKFIKEGEMLTTAQGNVKVDKYIKLTDEEKKSYNRALGYTRVIMINDEEKFLDLPKTAEDILVQLTSLMKEAGVDPLDYTYIISKTGTGLNTKYEVKKGDKVGQTGVVQSTIEEDVAADLTPEEKNVVDVLKNSIKEKDLDPKAPEVQKAYVEALTQNGIEGARAMDIYTKHFI